MGSLLPELNKTLMPLNKALMPVAREDSNFKDAPPSLFGAEFAKKAKEHIDHVKATSLPTTRHDHFLSPPPPQQGEKQLERHWHWPEQPKEGDTRAEPFKGKDPKELSRPGTDIPHFTKSHKQNCQKYPESGHGHGTSGSSTGSSRKANVSL